MRISSFGRGESQLLFMRINAPRVKAVASYTLLNIIDVLNPLLSNHVSHPTVGNCSIMILQTQLVHCKKRTTLLVASFASLPHEKENE